MWLYVGLGNPGTEYQNNRHNIGYLIIDEIVSHFGGAFKSKFHGQYVETRLEGHKVGFLKPETYMNESGISVKAAAKFYKIPPENIVIIHDELDLKPGEVRIKKDGGTAGHNGLKSLKAHLGTADFYRVRIGIGHPGDKDRVSDYVLSDFSKQEQSWVENTIHDVAKQCLSWIREDRIEIQKV